MKEKQTGNEDSRNKSNQYLWDPDGNNSIYKCNVQLLIIMNQTLIYMLD